MSERGLSAHTPLSCEQDVSPVGLRLTAIGRLIRELVLFRPALDRDGSQTGE
jgi:hypothetical protein